MYRRLPMSLAPDQPLTADLSSLISTTGNVDLLNCPDLPATHSQWHDRRIDQVRRAGINRRIQDEVLSRATDMGLQLLYLPRLSMDKPSSDTKGVPILITSPDKLRDLRKVVVIMNSQMRDLGIFSYGAIERGGLAAGSVLPLINKLDNDGFGLVMLNPGQLLWSYKAEAAVSMDEWLASPRPSEHHPAPVIHEANFVSNHRNPQEHLKSVMDTVINNPDYVAPDALLYLVGIEDAQDGLIDFLNSYWDLYEHRAAAVALTEPWVNLQDAVQNSAFAKFMANRARAWKVHEYPLDTVLTVPRLVPQLTTSNADKSSTEPTLSNAYETVTDETTASLKSGSGRHSRKTNPGLRLSLDKLRDEIWEKGLGEGAMETSASGTDLFLDAKEAAAKTAKAMEHRDEMSRRRLSDLSHPELPQVKQSEIILLNSPQHMQKPEPHSSYQHPTQWEVDDVQPHAAPLVACPTFSSGEPRHSDCVFPTVWERVHEFFAEVADNPEHYINPSYTVVAPVVQEAVKSNENLQELENEMNARVQVTDVSRLFTNMTLSGSEPAVSQSSDSVKETDITDHADASTFKQSQTSGKLDPCSNTAEDENADDSKLDRPPPPQKSAPSVIAIAGHTIPKHLADRAGL